MQVLSIQEVNQVSGAFNYNNVINSATEGMTIGAILTGIALFTCPHASGGAAMAWALIPRCAALFGGIQFLMEVNNGFR